MIHCKKSNYSFKTELIGIKSDSIKLRPLGYVKRKSSYTLLEILIVITIIAILAGTHQVPNALRMRMVTEETVCDGQQRLLRDATTNYINSNNYKPQSFDELVDLGLLGAVPLCPSHGVYSWGIKTGKIDYSVIICSIHGAFPDSEDN